MHITLGPITPISLQTLLNLRTYIHFGPILTNMCEITFIFKKSSTLRYLINEWARLAVAMFS